MIATFTHWHRSMDDGDLRLVVERDGRIVECVELDIGELPYRPDLLVRLGQTARERLLEEALSQSTGLASPTPELTA